jgi:hypothetical protein
VSIATIIALVRDAVILGALAWIILFIYHAGENADLKADMKALQVQLTANAKTEAKYAEEARLAEAQRQVDNQAIVAAVGSHTDPVFVCHNPGRSAVPGAPAAPAGSAPAAGGSDAGPRENLRPAISAYELKYEGSLATCRAVLEAWPK